MNDSLRKICFAVILCVLSAGVAIADDGKEILARITAPLFERGVFL